jgi:hypothetical protein
MNEPTPNPETRIALCRQKEIRRAIHNSEWWFVITDVVGALTDSVDPSDYLKKMRKRAPELAAVLRGGSICPSIGLDFETAGGRQKLQCWNTEGIFRLTQSIPSPKAEPFERWLAKVGHERIREIEDPELATKCTPALYQAKGYSDDWIEKRMRSIAIRDELTDEWKKRGVREQREYAILTTEISKAVRHIIDQKDFADLATNAVFSTKDFKAVPAKYRALILDYIKDYVSMNQFAA